MAIRLDPPLVYLYPVITLIRSIEVFGRMLEVHIHGHSTELPAAVSLSGDYVNPIVRVVSTDAGRPHPWPFDSTPSCCFFFWWFFSISGDNVDWVVSVVLADAGSPNHGQCT